MEGDLPPPASSTSSPSSSSVSCSHRVAYNHHNREKFLFKVILPAIRDRSYPICLRDLQEDRRAAVLTKCLHAYCLNCIRSWSKLKRKCPLCTAEFDSLFCHINLRYGNYREEQLPAPRADEEASARAASNPSSRRRDFGRLRYGLDGSIGRTRPLPRRRSFGRPDSVPPDIIAERKLQWRASIYSRRLQAVPQSSGSGREQDIRRYSGWKERILQRIEPWIRRELHAILGDPDPSVIVHVATSVFLRSLEEKFNNPSREVDEDNLTVSLQPFLHDSTGIFWHELRCYAESPLNMETYDAVVEYKRLR